MLSTSYCSCGQALTYVDDERLDALMGRHTGYVHPEQHRLIGDVTSPETASSDDRSMLPRQDGDKDVVLLFIEEVVNRGNLDVLERTVDPTFVTRVATDHEHSGMDHLREVIVDSRSYFPDLQCRVESLLREREVIVACGQVSGTHMDGPFALQKPLPHRFMGQFIQLFRVTDGLIAEHWSVRDDLGILDHTCPGGVDLD